MAAVEHIVQVKYTERAEFMRRGRLVNLFGQLDYHLLLWSRMMTRAQWGKLHKWIFIFTGVFLLAWLVSGILMLTPNHWFGDPESQTSSYSINYSRITLSPADIISGLEAEKGASQDISWVKLKQIRDRPLYAVKLSNEETQLFDAQTGQPFIVTQELAEALARDAFPTTASVHSIEKLENHDLLYSWGPLPAYRFRFEDHPSNIITVIPEDAKVMQLTPIMGIRRAIIGLHGFEPIKLITDNNDVRTGLMSISGIIILLGALIGIYLTLPVRRKEKLD